MHSIIGDEFGHYRIVEYLGRGGMGAVYKALDGRLERPVAIKFLHESWVSDSNALRRFQREARTASALNHPNICVIHDFGESGGRHYLVMEWLEGATLQHYLASRQPRVEEILQWSIELSSAVNYAHAHGVIHRDLKPANVFVSRSGQVKILDFGLAKPMAAENAASSATGTTFPDGDLTSPGVAIGTVGYMSPEQARGEEIDGRSDVFSLGAIMYEMVARRRAFAGETNAVVYDSILNRTPSRVRQFNPNVPAEFDDIIISKALEKDRSLRYQTAADLHADLKRLKRDLAQGNNSEPIPVTGPAPTGSVSRRQFVFVFGGGVAAGLATAGVAAFVMADSEISRIAVLPFANTVEDEATDYLAAGLTESVRNALSDVPGLDVYPSIVSNFDGPDFDLALIQDQLDADAIVTATVSPRAEGASAIQVDLIDLRSGFTIWGNSYPFVDPLSVQDSIARDIAVNLSVRLSGEDEEQLEIRRLLEEARSRWERRNEAELEAARTLYDQVLRLDFRNAEAYAGLALVYAVYPIYSQVDPAEYARLAKEAAETVRELGAGLADAHNALALVAVNFDHDWDQADREYDLAIALDPDNATTYQWRAEYLTAIGEFEAALVALEAAERADPLSLVIPSVRGWVYYCAGRSEEAVDQLLRVLDRKPDFGLAHRFLGQTYVQTGDYERALDTLRYANQLGAGRRGDIAYAEARLGNRDEALQILGDMIETGASPYDVAIVQAGLGDADAAIVALEEGIGRGSWELVNLNVEPQFEPIRSDPRFAEILASLELEP